MDGYSEKVLEHFKNPRNAGTIEDASDVGEIGDPSCGDFLRVFIKVSNDKVTDVKYQIKSCPAAIACASAMSEIVTGKDLDDAIMITEDDIVNALDGLPESKVHYSALAISALRMAIMDYFNKHVRS
ncbi:MAG: iron-sulfur cluster assembly scaffold protein [Proteobacteria bacterium]|nr:iron-sulfur cluster assembly scaffold protein [Pseudomonadota bacterium]